jgi:ribosome-binding factor A
VDDVAAELRKRRLESLLAELVSDILLRGRIHDPRVQRMMSVTEVKAAKDLRDATVYVSVVDRRAAGLPSSRDDRADAIEALNHAAGFVQHLVAEHLTLRVTPRLRFVLDTSVERGVNLSRKLDELGQVPDELEH